MVDPNGLSATYGPKVGGEKRQGPVTGTAPAPAAPSTPAPEVPPPAVESAPSPPEVTAKIEKPDYPVQEEFREKPEESAPAPEELTEEEHSTRGLLRGLIGFGSLEEARKGLLPNPFNAEERRGLIESAPERFLSYHPLVGALQRSRRMRGNALTFLDDQAPYTARAEAGAEWVGSAGAMIFGALGARKLGASGGPPPGWPDTPQPTTPGPGPTGGGGGGGYKIVDGTHRARAAHQLGIGSVEAELFQGDKFLGRLKVRIDELRSPKSVIDLSGKGTFRWLRALREMAAGESGPIKIERAPGGTPVSQIKIQRARD